MFSISAGAFGQQYVTMEKSIVGALRERMLILQSILPSSFLYSRGSHDTTKSSALRLVRRWGRTQAPLNNLVLDTRIASVAVAKLFLASWETIDQALIVGGKVEAAALVDCLKTLPGGQVAWSLGHL